MKGIKTSIPFHRKVVQHPVFLKGRYDTGFIDDHMDGGRGAPETENGGMDETRRVAFILAAIVAYRIDKERASRASDAATKNPGENPWKQQGRRAQMRGNLP